MASHWLLVIATVLTAVGVVGTRCDASSHIEAHLEELAGGLAEQSQRLERIEALLERLIQVVVPSTATPPSTAR